MNCSICKTELVNPPFHTSRPITEGICCNECKQHILLCRIGAEKCFKKDGKFIFLNEDQIKEYNNTLNKKKTKEI